MFALLAAGCFLLSLVIDNLGPVGLVKLGLLFVALQLLIDVRPWHRARS